MAMAAGIDAVSFMMESFRTEDSDWVVCIGKLTMLIKRQYSTHLGPGRLFYILMNVT
jgi:hypothetical protein